MIDNGLRCFAVEEHVGALSSAPIREQKASIGLHDGRRGKQLRRVSARTLSKSSLRALDQVQFDEKLTDFVGEYASKFLARQTVEKEVHDVRQIGQDVLENARVEAELVQFDLAVADIGAGASNEQLSRIEDFDEHEEYRVRYVADDQRESDGEQHARHLGVGATFVRENDVDR